MLAVNPPDVEGTALPHVSVVLPARDCAELLPDCLAAIDAQTYQGVVDLTVAVAPSTDDTRRVLTDARLGAPMKVPMNVIDNPAGTTPAGLNAAIAASDGTVVVRVDAQARIPPDYIERAVATLGASEAANVGGVQRPVGGPGLAGAVAAALASPFGAGPAAFRRGRRSGPVDTVYLGVFDRSVLASVGGFDESLERNQDYELNWRLRSAGHSVWLDAGLVVDYVPRAGYPALARQYFAYGAWKRRILLRHPRSLRVRQLAAPALLVSLVVSLVQLLRGRPSGVVVPLAYTGASALAAAQLRPTLQSAKSLLGAMGAFGVMHLAWGVGFLFGRTRRR